MSGRGTNPNSHIDKGLRKGRLNIAKEQSMAEKQEDNLIDWCTFYRRNIHRFIEHYFGIQLHFYQKIMIYLMNTCPLVVLLCSRAVGKRFAHFKLHSNRWNLSKLIIDNINRIW